jgi:hypothetical protein
LSLRRLSGLDALHKLAVTQDPHQQLPCRLGELVEPRCERVLRLAFEDRSKRIEVRASRACRDHIGERTLLLPSELATGRQHRRHGIRASHDRCIERRHRREVGNQRLGTAEDLRRALKARPPMSQGSCRLSRHD